MAYSDQTQYPRGNVDSLLGSILVVAGVGVKIKAASIVIANASGATVSGNIEDASGTALIPVEIANGESFIHEAGFESSNGLRIPAFGALVEASVFYFTN